MGVEVRLARPADAAAIGEVFARAFADDPVTSWVTSDARRRERLLRRLNTAIARDEGIPRGATYVAIDGGTLVGAGIWQPPGRIPVSWRHLRFSLVAGAAIGRSIPRTVVAGRAAARARPREQHWYLQLLGVDPSAQHTGLGSQLVRAHLGHVDQQRLPAYLETTAENLNFYARLGFVSSGAIVLHRTAPPEFSLYRQPQEPGATPR